MKTVLGLFTLIVLGLAIAFFTIDNEKNLPLASVSEAIPQKSSLVKTTSSPARTLPSSLPSEKILQTDYHVFQSFNNCAPAALSMALSYYGIRVSQEELAADLRPYNNPKGINDDKSTPPAELAAKAQEYGLIPYFRAHGSFDLMRQFIAQDIPVLVRTLLYPDKDFAHYRVIKGYNDQAREIIQDDSFNGKNLRFSYEKFAELWRPFNNAYLVLVPQGKQDSIEAILGDDVDAKTSWRKALQAAARELEGNAADLTTRFNASVAAYYVGDYDRSVQEFEKIESQLPRHTLWYQPEPLTAYRALGREDRVLSLTAKILEDNVSYEELYLLRGRVYLQRGDLDRARQEFEKAVLYNKNSATAKEALNLLR